MDKKVIRDLYPIIILPETLFLTNNEGKLDMKKFVVLAGTLVSILALCLLLSFTATQDAKPAYEHTNFTAHYTYHCYENGEVCKVTFKKCVR